MFTVRLNIMAEEEQRLRQLSVSLLNAEKTIETIRAGLNESIEIKDSDEIDHVIAKLKSKVNEEGMLLKKMSDVLSNVIAQYKDTEQRIITEAEEIALTHKNVSAGYEDLSWYEKKLSGIKFR